MFSSNEYGLKLDSYFYDENRKSIIIAIKVRNKRTINKFTIHEILCNSEILVKLHPIDLCTLGILANTTESIVKINKSRLARILDGFSMEKISPYLDVVKRNFINEEEVVTLRLKCTNETILITLNQLYNNKNLINALEYKDAIALGYSIGNLDDFSPDKIVHLENEYCSLTCIRNASFLSFILISFLISTIVLDANFLGLNVNFHAEILLFPILMILQDSIVINQKTNKASKIFMMIIVSLIVFIAYYAIIASMPYPDKNINTQKFNDYYSIISTSRSPFILGLLGACLINIYSIAVIKRKIENFHSYTKSMISHSVFVTGFFIVSSLVCYFYKKACYSFIHFYYCAFFIFIATCIGYIRERLSLRGYFSFDQKVLLNKLIP